MGKSRNHVNKEFGSRFDKMRNRKRVKNNSKNREIIDIEMQEPDFEFEEFER